MSVVVDLVPPRRLVPSTVFPLQEIRISVSTFGGFVITWEILTNVLSSRNIFSWDKKLMAKVISDALTVLDD